MTTPSDPARRAELYEKLLRFNASELISGAYALDDGGIIITDTAKEKPSEGMIVAAGNGKVGEDGKVTPLDVKKGDRILFSKYAGTEVNVAGEEHIIIREDDVLGVVE